MVNPKRSGVDDEQRNRNEVARRGSYDPEGKRARALAGCCRAGCVKGSSPCLAIVFGGTMREHCGRKATAPPARAGEADRRSSGWAFSERVDVVAEIVEVEAYRVEILAKQGGELGGGLEDLDGDAFC